MGFKPTTPDLEVQPRYHYATVTRNVGLFDARIVFRGSSIVRRQKVPPVGFEPRTSDLEVQRRYHYATAACAEGKPRDLVLVDGVFSVVPRVRRCGSVSVTGRAENLCQRDSNPRPSGEIQ